MPFCFTSTLIRNLLNVLYLKNSFEKSSLMVCDKLRASQLCSLLVLDQCDVLTSGGLLAHLFPNGCKLVEHSNHVPTAMNSVYLPSIWYILVMMVDCEVRNHDDHIGFYLIFASKGRIAKREERIHPISLDSTRLKHRPFWRKIWKPYYPYRII